MSRKLQTRGRFPVPPESMLVVMTDPELLKRQHRMQGAIEVDVQERERNAGSLVIKVAVREYWRNLKGIDKNRIEDAETSYTWNLSEHSCKWRYRGPRGDMVRISGAIDIEPAEEGCLVLSEVTVHVPVPILGGMLEKRIAGEIEAGFAPFEELLLEFCKDA